MFYDNYVKLCAAAGKSPSAVAQEIGLYKSTVSNWKNRGTKPTDATAQRIADHFGVPVSVLYETDSVLPYVSAAIRATYDPLNPFKTQQLLNSLAGFDEQDEKETKKPVTVSGDEPEDVTRKIMDLLSDFSYEELVLALARIRKIKESR